MTHSMTLFTPDPRFTFPVCEFVYYSLIIFLPLDYFTSSTVKYILIFLLCLCKHTHTHTQSFSNENWALLYNCPMTCFSYSIPSLGGSDGKASACSAGDLGFNFWVGKIPWRTEQQPTPVFLPGESPRTEEPGRLQSMGSQRVRQD